MASTVNGNTTKASGYAPVNGLKMYYEMEGTGDPLVFIPPAFGFAGLESFPALVESHTVLTVDLQGNGRTVDIPERPLSIERYAEDVVGLLKHLGIAKADLFAESYGGNTAVMIAVRYPEAVGRVATYGATFGSPQVAVGYGLEGILSDSKADKIGRDMIPLLRSNNFDGAVILAAEEIAKVVTADAKVKSNSSPEQQVPIN